MLFNSYQFIFMFLPVALAGYFVAGRFGNLAPVIWLALASMVFYSVSNWQFVALLLASIAFNYLIGLLLISGRLRPALRFAALTAGVAGDLSEEFFEGNFHAPAEASLRVAVVHDQPGNVVGTRSHIRLWSMRAKARVAPGIELSQ